MDVQVPTSSSNVNDAEQAVRFAQEALIDAQLATRAAESTLLARRADEADAQRIYDRAAELVRDLYVAERQRLEEAARIADAALRELDDKLRALRPGETEPAASPPDAGSLIALDGDAEAGPEAAVEHATAHARVDAGTRVDADAEDWLATLRRESENERRAPDGT